MYEVIKEYFYLVLSVTIFMGICVAWGGIYGIIINTKEIDNKKLKILLRCIISVILVIFWLWFIVYKYLFPVSLAKYEYEHDVYVTDTGIIENIEQHSKDRINITIGGAKYIIIPETDLPSYIKLFDILEKGNYVRFSYGEKSKFIFDILNDN